MIGDFHTHMNGNGAINRWGNVKKICTSAKKLNYDVVFLGCHDHVCSKEMAESAREEFNIDIVRGAEISTNIGHLLALNIDHIPKDCWANNKNPLNIFKAISFIKKQGGRVVLAHPFRDNLDKYISIDFYDSLEILDGIEIANYNAFLSTGVKTFPYISGYGSLKMFKNSDIHPWQKNSIMHKDFSTTIDLEWFGDIKN